MTWCRKHSLQVFKSCLFVSVLTAMPGLSCRFYQHRFPEVEDVVMVNVRSIAEMGAYVSLLEYNNIEGMILLSELSRRRIRSINKLIRIGRNECVVVIRVDKEKGGYRQVYWALEMNWSEKYLMCLVANVKAVSNTSSIVKRCGTINLLSFTGSWMEKENNPLL